MKAHLHRLSIKTKDGKSFPSLVEADIRLDDRRIQCSRVEVILDYNEVTTEVRLTLPAVVLDIDGVAAVRMASNVFIPPSDETS